MSMDLTIPNVARLTADWMVRDDQKVLAAGDLILLDDDRGLAWSKLKGQGYSRKQHELSFEREPELSWKDIPALLEYYLAGKMMAPHLGPMSDRDGMNYIAAGAGLSVWPEIAHIRLPGDQHGRWARVFLSYTQGGALDGTGVLVAWMRSNEEKPQAWRFALCQHEKQMGAGAKPWRGWHPGSCSKCGLDMTVDSGD